MFRIDYPFKKEILACGTQKQANFCLTKKNYGFVVNDLGCLDEEAHFMRYQQEIEQLKKDQEINPKLIAADLDNESLCTKYAQILSQKAKGAKFIPVQHHLAHLASCLGENEIKERIIGVVFDGSGQGDDGNNWGGEFFVGSLEGFKRVAHLKYTPLLNRGKGNLEAWLEAASFLYQAYGENFEGLGLEFLKRYTKEQWQIFKQDLAHSCASSSMAGLFDGICALLGLRDKLDYEGQGAAELERIVNRSSHVTNQTYEFTLSREKDQLIFSPQPIFQNIISDLEHNISKSIISAAFYNTVVGMVEQICRKIKHKEKVKDVVLSGSMFMNKFLFNRVKDLLTQDGFTVLTHKNFPGNDSYISFGQAVLANTIKEER